MTRAKSNSKRRVLQRLGKGDELVEMDVSRHARGQDASLARVWTMRAIRYHRKRFLPQTLLTSLLDANQSPRPAGRIERLLELRPPLADGPVPVLDLGLVLHRHHGLSTR
ncbi:MAG TPA: hypothetical protein VLT33_38370 [Labilithrix sp.]|nr:hypothetical protein [Labilithrix sp.]